MKLEPGRNLLHYRLAEKIGEGGMGVVWKARDTNLDRDVAIKILPEGISAEPDRLARFEREAKLLAVLDHPNIAAVYGLHQADDQRFIAMEFVTGEDLAQRLARGPLPTEDALDIARQVAAALEAAHEQGVIHRDLKPANIKYTPEGKVKVLDLGLAKALVQETSGDGASLSLSPTLTSAGTIAGTLLGTAAYMSPEQAKGRAVDRRADIWAFGVVLCEMLTGKKMFEAETISETLAAVLRDEVSFDGLPAAVPAPVKSLLQRCLDRNPRTRLRDIGEARIALSSEALTSGDAGAAAGAAPAAARPSGPARLLPWVLVALLAAVAAFAFMWKPRGNSGHGDLLTLVAPVPQEKTLTAGLTGQLGMIALSPDGRTLALTIAEDNQRMLYIRKLDRDELLPLPGTENAVTPFFSPDGQWIGFFAGEALKKVSVNGGAPITLCTSDGDNRGGSWGSDDFIVFSPHYTEPLMRVSGAGGVPQPLTAIDTAAGERSHRWPQAVPGEDLVLFTVGTFDSPEGYDDSRIDAVRPSTGERLTVYQGASLARYVPTGHLVIARGGFLFALPFDIDSLEVGGTPVPVLENVLGAAGSGIVHAEFAQTGLLAFVAGTSQSRQSRLIWRQRDGTTEALDAPPSNYGALEISPDGRRIAAVIYGTATSDIWTYQIEQDTLTRLTFEGDNRSPVWSPDGRQIAFASVRNKELSSTYVKATDGSGPAELRHSPDAFGPTNGLVVPTSWTPDGRHMLVEYADQNLRNIGFFSEEEGASTSLAETPAVEIRPMISPNGRWVAYMSNETGAYEIFVQAFPGPGGKWQVSNAGGGMPRWSPDGKELFYVWDTILYGVAVDDSGASFNSGRPYVLLEELPTNTRRYDVLDADRFLFREPLGEESGIPGVTVVVNWFDELERLVPE